MQLLRQTLKEQFHAGLAMLTECVERCPADLWISGTHPRAFWRIAFHTVYFTHLYLGQNDAAYQPWPNRPAGTPELWQPPWSVEPYELPEGFPVYTKTQILNYLAYVDAILDSTIEGLDLESPESGFFWYENINKLSHVLLNLRHLQGHVGQLSELLMARDIDIDWINRAQQATQTP